MEACSQKAGAQAKPPGSTDPYLNSQKFTVILVELKYWCNTWMWMCVCVASGISTFYKDSVVRSWNRTVCCWKCSTMFAKVWSLIMWSIIHPWLRTIIEVDTAEHWSPPRIKGGGRDGDSLIGEPTEVVSTLETLRQVALGAACCRLNTEGQSRSVVAVAAKGFEGFWKVEWIECSMSLMMSRYV